MVAEVPPRSRRPGCWSRRARERAFLWAPHVPLLTHCAIMVRGVVSTTRPSASNLVRRADAVDASHRRRACA